MAEKQTRGCARSLHQTNLMEPHGEIGIIDDKGVLWPATSVGKFCSPAQGQATLWDCITTACAKYTGEKCVGERAVVLKQEVAGFEKFIMGPYSFIT